MGKPELKRELSLFQVTFAGIGVIMGAGIYALIGKAASIAGTSIWLSFLIAAIIAILTAFSYAELSALFPKAGAEYVYTNKAFGKKLAFLIGWLVGIGGIIGAATVSLGFGGYFSAMFGIPVVYSSLIVLALSALILMYGVKESVNAAVIGTIVEMLGLAIIIILAIPYIGSVDYFELPSIPAILSGASLVFFAYLGFEEMSRMAEEAKNPQKTMPKAILLAIFFSSIIYILVAISAVSVLSPEALGSSKSPLADIASKVLGPEASLVVAISALFATANTVLMMLFASSRLVYGMAGKSLLSHVHPERRTPISAIILVTIVAISFVILFRKIEVIAYLTDFTLFVAFVIVNCGLIWLRKTQPNLHRPFKVPSLIFPALGAIFSFGMLFTMSLDIVLIGIGIILVGLLLYDLFLNKKERKN